jgi:hypothetical protein
MLTFFTTPRLLQNTFNGPLIAKYTEHQQLACFTMQQSYPDRIAMPQTHFQKLTPQLCFVVLRSLQSVHSVHRAVVLFCCGVEWQVTILPT